MPSVLPAAALSPTTGGGARLAGPPSGQARPGVDDAAEARRLAALRSYEILDTGPEAAFDDLARLAAQLCGTPIAQVNLMDAVRLWHKASIGFEGTETPREESLCEHALQVDGMLVVPDARNDERFAANPNVVPDGGIRLYAGVPLRTDDGDALGTLCVADTVPRDLSPLQLEQLAALGRQVMAQLTLRRQRLELEEELTARVAATEALAANEQLLRGVLDHTDALVYAKDLDGRFTLVNRTMEAVLQRSSDELLGACDHDLFPTAVADEYASNDAMIATSGGRQVFGERLEHADGSVHDFLSTKFALRDELGAVYGIAGVSADVTELAGQRRALAESEERWRSLAEHSLVAVTVLDEDRRFLYANPAAIRLYGASSPDDLLGTRSTAYLVDATEAPAATFAAVLAGGTLAGRQVSLRRRDGAVVQAEINAAGIEYGGRSAVQVELRDMTDQLRAETAIRESEQHWRLLFSGSPVGIGVADERGRIVSANGALCALLGRPAGEIVGRTLNDFTHPDDRSTRAHSHTLIDASTDGTARVERRYIRADGECRWAWLTMARTPGPDGATWMLGHFQDITERKAVEDATAREAADLAAIAAIAARIQQGEDARQTIVEAGVQLAGASFVSLLEPGPHDRTLVVTASTHGHLVGERLSLTARNATVGVYRSGEPLLLTDPDSDPRVSQAHLRMTGARSFYVAPVRAGDRVTATLLVGWDHRVNGLEDRRMTTIGLLAGQAGVALRQAALVAELEQLAVTDPLTVLPNRRGWDRMLAASMADAARSGAPLTVALADVDHFKRFNDTHGHGAGDELLRSFGHGLRRALRRGDVAARWGGEEFAFALSDCPAGQAAGVLARFRDAVPMAQTCSIGFATWDGEECADALMARADAALYRAKDAGRDTIVAGEPAR